MLWGTRVENFTLKITLTRSILPKVKISNKIFRQDSLCRTSYSTWTEIVPRRDKTLRAVCSKLVIKMWISN